MASKIGPNERCPCGSGKKYKKCHRFADEQSGLPQGAGSMTRAFATFDRKQLLGVLAALQTTERGQAQMVRLERAAQVAASLRYAGTRSVDLRELGRCLNGDPSLRALIQEEDPACGFLTENVTFHGGNFTCYTGINEHASYILRHMLRGALGTTSRLRAGLKQVLKPEVQALLRLSGHIAGRNGHLPWQEAKDFAQQEINVTPGDVQRWGHFYFDSQALARLGVLPAVVAPFVAPLDELSKSVFTAGDRASGLHPLNARPLVDVDGGLVVAMPCGLAPALRHRMVSYCGLHGALDELLRSYWMSIDAEADELLERMGYEHVAHPAEADSDEAPSIAESLWRFDVDKLCCFIRAADVGDGYRVETPWQDYDGRTLSRRITERMRAISQALVPFPGELLFIVTFAQLGRRGGISVVPPSGEKVRVLTLGCAEFETLVKQRDADNLTIWKFVRDRDEAARSTTIQAWSVLDEYAVYRRGECSFHFSEDGIPGVVHIGPEMHHDLVVKAGKLAGLHSVRIDGSRMRDVVRFDDDDAPIWMPAAGPGSEGILLVEIFRQPVWVQMDEEAGGAEHHDQANLLITRAVAYWTWQLADVIRPWMASCDDEPIDVLVALEQNFWTAWSPEEAADAGSTRIAVEVAGKRIRLGLPRALAKTMASPRNEADREIVRALAEGFAAVATALGAAKGIDEGALLGVVDVVAPLGFRKMLLVPDVAADPRLLPLDLPRVRLLQERDDTARQEGLGDVVRRGLGFQDGRVTVPPTRFKEALKLLIDDGFEKLRRALAKFHSSYLLRYLLYRNEAATHDAAQAELTRVTVAACYPETHGQASKTAELTSKAAESSIALRFLIEYTVAEWPTGSAGAISDSDYDELLAAAHNVLFWGSLAEEVRGQLLHPTLTLLPSGRISVEAAPRRLWDFMVAKTLEARDAQARRGMAEDEPDASEEGSRAIDALNAAYKAEFGVTAVELRTLTECLMAIAVKLERSVVCMPWDELVATASADSRLAEGKVTAAIRALSLEAAKGWRERATKEALPWLYKRDRSYMRRPIVLVVGDGKGETGITVMFGMRQLCVSVRQLGRSIQSGDFPQDQATTPALQKLLGARLNERGSKFERFAAERLAALTSWRIHPQVEIGPGKLLEHDVDLGDIDLFCVDEVRALVFAIECKAISFGRNAREMAGELDELFRDRKGRSSKTSKHLARMAWLQANWNQTCRALGLTTEQSWALIGALLTEQEMPTVYLMAPPLPVIALSSVERTAAQVLIDLGSDSAARRMRGAG